MEQGRHLCFDLDTTDYNSIDNMEFTNSCAKKCETMLCAANKGLVTRAGKVTIFVSGALHHV